VLEKIAVEDKDWYCRCEAKERLSELSEDENAKRVGKDSS
jgi:hypothetical protein